MDGLSAVGILADLSLGLNMARLLRLEKKLRCLNVPIRPLLQALSACYRDRMAKRPVRNAGILSVLDTVMNETAMLPAGNVRKTAIAALTGIRRDLFPEVPFFSPESRHGNNRHETGLSVANGP